MTKGENATTFVPNVIQFVSERTIIVTVNRLFSNRYILCYTDKV